MYIPLLKSPQGHPIFSRIRPKFFVGNVCSSIISSLRREVLRGRSLDLWKQSTSYRTVNPQPWNQLVQVGWTPLLLLFPQVYLTYLADSPQSS